MEPYGGLNYTPCDKMDPAYVDAFFKYSYNVEEPTTLCLNNSWGDICFDYDPIVKAGQTITHLLLTDSALQFNREDYGVEGADNGGVDCIAGTALSRIIRMQLLQDVAPEQIGPGEVYMYDGEYFMPFGLQNKLNNIDAAVAQNAQNISTLQANVTTLNQQVTAIQSAIGSLNQMITTIQGQIADIQNDISQLQTTVNNHGSRLTTIETTLQKPTGIPSNTRLVWGNTNQIADYTNANNNNWGLFTHNPANTIANDTYFS